MKKIFCAFLCLMLCVISSGCNNISYTHKQTVVFSNINFEVDMIGGNIAQAYNEMLEMMDELNKQVNVNVADVDMIAEGENHSDILRLNLANGGDTVQIGYHAYYLLEVAKEMYELTQGAFNVAAYPLAYLWGVDAVSCNYYNNNFTYEDSPVPPSFARSAISPQFKPTKEQVEQVMAYCDFDDIQIWESDGEYFAQKNITEAAVDLGAIAKGYAADLCADICLKNRIESAFINISGNIYMYGKMYDGKWLNEWEVGLREPQTYSSNMLCKFKTAIDSTAVTSGDYERTRMLVNDLEEAESATNEEFLELVQYAPHIIDSRRGVPYTLEIVESELGEWDYYNTESHVVSATIIGENSMYADCFATAACVMGLNEGKEFLTSLTDFNIKALVFASDLRYANINGVQLTKTDVYNGFASYQLVE